jgi:hypothetical protein
MKMNMNMNVNITINININLNINMKMSMILKNIMLECRAGERLSPPSLFLLLVHHVSPAAEVQHRGEASTAIVTD